VNIQEYISSGVVEAYVLGLASAEERAEFERMTAQHPEVRAAREAFEVALEKQAMEGAIAPPSNLKNKIWTSLQSGHAQTQAEIVPLRRSSGWMKFAVAASLILLAVCAYLYVTEKNKNEDLAKENATIKATRDSIQNELARIEEAKKIMWDNPAVKMAKLEGTPMAPQSYATVYWDTTSKDVYLVVSNLPAPASDQQYQLWALLDGKPIDMGMLEVTQKPLQLYRMKNAQNAQAFAISLEKKGGSPTPTTVYMVGKL
jgi:anti-sigma-K factor RskA